MNDLLKTATAVVGLLAGIVTGTYLLGGMVIALRLLFDSYDFNAVVLVLGQLPREPVIATALLDVVAPAATFGLLAAVYYGARNRPRPRKAPDDDLNKGRGSLFLRWIFFPAVAVGLCVPAIHQAYATDGLSLLLLSSAFGIAVTWAALASGWFLKRRVGRRSWPRLLRALAGGAIFAVVALTPAAMIASAISFEPAQVCTSDTQVPQKGRLIGEGGGRLLLEEHLGRDSDVVSLPTERITRTEFGDVSSTFPCPLPDGQGAAAKEAEADLGGHGSETERELAMKLRPYLFFDSRERWRPLEVERFLGEGFPGDQHHEACVRGRKPECKPTAGLSELGPGTAAPDYLDIHGEEENGVDYRSPHRFCHTLKPRAYDCNGGRSSVVYYRRTTHGGRWYWDYWWFFRYNDYTSYFAKCSSRLCSDHEGDWEGITIVTTPSRQPQLLGALYAAHKNRVLVEGGELPTADGHPLVFVAEGTHASYPFRCAQPRNCQQYATLAGIEHLPEDPHDGSIPWGGNGDRDCETFHCVRPLPEVGHPSDLAQPLAGKWAAWRGHWGATCSDGCNAALSERQPSPSSPGLQIRFQCPWAATDWALPGGAAGLSRSERAGDADRLLAECAALRGGL